MLPLRKTVQEFVSLVKEDFKTLLKKYVTPFITSITYDY